MVPLKIAHVCSFYKPAICGAGRVVYELATRQARAGHDVHVFTSDFDKKKRIPIKEEIIDGVKVHRCVHIFRASQLTTVWPSVIPKLILGQFDIVHTHSFGQAHVFFGAVAGRLSGAKLVHTTHGPWVATYRPPLAKMFLWPSHNLFGRIALHLTNRVIAITDWEVPMIRAHGGRSVTTIQNGVSEKFFVRKEPNTFKEKYGIKNKFVLYLGRLNESKAPHILALAAKKILEKRKDWDFVITGPDEGMLQALKEIAGDDRNIRLIQPPLSDDETIEAFQAADLYVLPTRREGFPLTIYEAMAAGAPVVATAVASIPYEMKVPDNGLLAELDNVQDFADKITYLMEHDELRRQIQKNNYAKAKGQKWNLVAERIENVYRELKLTN